MPDFKRVLVVSKMTNMEFYEQRWGHFTREICEEYNIDYDKERQEHLFHHTTLDQLLKMLEKQGIRPGQVNGKGSLSSFDFENPWDLVIPVGGDGTFLDTSRYILDDTLVFGVKSSPGSIGGHYNTDYSSMERHLDALLDGSFAVEERVRVVGTMQNRHRIQDIALNEIFIGDKYNPGYSKIVIGNISKIGQEHEQYYGCSGLVVSTFRGKTGWFDSIKIMEKDSTVIQQYQDAHRLAGLTPRDTLIPEAEFQPDDQRLIRYKIREYSNRGEQKGTEFGILLPGEKILVTSNMLVDGCASFDGSKQDRPRSRMYDLHLGATITIQVSEHPLYVVTF
jgi:NAD kinase